MGRPDLYGCKSCKFLKPSGRCKKLLKLWWRIFITDHRKSYTMTETQAIKEMVDHANKCFIEHGKNCKFFKPKED